MASRRLTCGLVPKGKDSSLPLKNVSVDIQVKGVVVGLHSTLTYYNDSSDPVEVLFRFPAEESHAVVGLTALIDGRKIKADIREKEEARAQYDDAIASGLSAALAEEKSGDIFSVALGNLPPGKDAQLQLKLVGELGIYDEGGFIFSLPATLKPRYTPVGSADPLTSVPAGEGGKVESGSVSAMSWFHMTVEGAGDVAEITSPTHSITVTPNDADQLNVCLSKEKELGSNVLILVKHKTPHVPKVVVEAADVEKKGEFMSNPAVMLNFSPNFANTEFIFVVDRSLSMNGMYIQSARETLMLFLKSIPEGSYFNIVGFGSSYTTLFKNTVPYDEKHLKKAMKHAQEMQADLGGTELLTPLQYIFGMKPRSGYSRQVFVLTDGSVSNTSACIQQMENNVKSARCFTFGIGSGASTALVEGLAHAGKGAAEFVKEGERMQPKVIRSLKRALQPYFTDVSVLFQLPKGYEVLQSPQNLPPIFNGGGMVVAYGVLKGKAVSKKIIVCTATLRGNTLGAKVEHKVPFILDSSTAAPSMPVIHHLAAKALITDWESEQKEKKSIVDLSIESCVISSHTAFIAIDEESSEPVSGTMKTYDILPHQDVYLNAMAFYTAPGGGGGRGWIKRKKAPSQKAQMCISPPQGPLSHHSADYRLAIVSAGLDMGDISVPPPPLPQHCGESIALLCSSRPQSAGKATDKLADLITAQQLNGSWTLDASLAQLIGKSLSNLESACPIDRKGVGATVWATVLALSLLRSRYSSQQEEWELIVMKAESWLKKQSLPPGYTLEQLFQVAEDQFL